MNDPDSSVRSATSEPGEPLPAPRPMRKRRLWRALLDAAGLTITVGGVVFIVVASSMSRVRGATRSARLKWEERQRQVDQAVRDATDSPARAPNVVADTTASADPLSDS